MNLDDLLNDLNAEQKEAATHGDGPFLIIAGAGTGKTTVITRRIGWLAATGRAKQEEILALTFTEKAAQEMEERVDELMPYGATENRIGTFHAFCERLLHEYGLAIGLPNNFRILDATDQWLLVRKNFDKFSLDYYRPRGNPTKYIHALLKLFSRAKDEAIRPEDYLNYAKKLRTESDNAEFTSDAVKEAEEIASAYAAYQQILLDEEALDFGDLLVYALELFTKRPRILERVRQNIKYILVDEFQDTNWAQYEIIKLLAGGKSNLTVVGDDDQAIYKFRGASVANILQFKNDYPAAKQIVLKENYRTRQNILDRAYEFIQLNNPNRLEVALKTDNQTPLSKKLSAAQKGNGEIEHLCFKTVGAEASGVAQKIETLVSEGKASWSDCAVLVRSNDSAAPFSQSFDRRGIPYQFLALRGLYRKPVILDIVSYFKLLDNYHESPALYRVMTSLVFDIPAEDIVEISLEAKKRSESLYAVSEKAAAIPRLSKKGLTNIENLLSLIKKHTLLAKERSVSEILLAFLKDSSYLNFLKKETRDARESLRFVQQFHERIKKFEESHPEPRVRNFLEEFLLELEAGEAGHLNFDFDIGPDMVKIMTVHAAKGLEFPYVFVVSMVEQRFPTIERGDQIEMPEALIKEKLPQGDAHLEEERRLFYVAMTRAKYGLFLTSAEDYGGARKKKISRFLRELNFSSVPETAGAENEIAEEPTQQIAAFSEVKTINKAFSFSQLAAFETCPLQYKFFHVLNLPIFGSFTKSFGSSIHHTLEAFMKLWLERTGAIQQDLFGAAAKDSSEEKTPPVSLEELEQFYERYWQNGWYLNPRQKDEYKLRGKKMIKSFYENFIEAKPKPILIEEPFKLKIGDIILKGKIDRVDDLGAEGLEIIDYKTGTKKEKLGTAEKFQLLLYQMALEARGARVKFLSYYYLEDGTKLSFSGGEEDRTKLEEKIVSQVKEIKKNDFKATPGIHCRYCDFKDICEFRA